MFSSGYFIGHDEQAFWGASLFRGEHNHILHEMHDVPEWVSYSSFVAMLIGFAIAWLYYIRAPWLPAATARAFRPLYLFLLNKWYFDELYDLLFVRPAFAIGRFLWKGGDGAVIDGAIDGTAASVGRVTGARRQAADRLHLPLRLRDADRRRGAADLAHLQRNFRRGDQMSNILSVTTFLPLVGALLIATLNAEANGNARWIALWTTLITFFVSLLIWWNFDTTTGRLSVRRRI